MAEQVKWGVLGNAMIARKCVLPAIHNSCNGLVQALGTRSPAAAEEVAHENDIRRVYNTYGAVLEDPDVNAVYIPLPNHMHLPWTLRALDAGKHVLCEKPLACNAGEARRMMDKAAASGLLMMEAFMYRFHPRSRQIKRLVSAGVIGRPCLVRAAFCYHMKDDIFHSGANTRLKPDMGGGALLDVGCYGVSVARWLMAAEPVAAQAQAVYHPDGVDVHLVGTLRFADGQLAVVEASFIAALQQTFTVVGSEGALELPHDAFIPWKKDAVYTHRTRDEEAGETHIVKGADEYQLMVEHFADAVLKKTELDYSPDDSIANMRVLDALSEAAQTGKTVNLNTQQNT
ncbi:MAG: Gfo/Idh/MocA family oxidoreductase [Desulfobacterales bacterium]|nr:MAG: Gfo/Idh/MocA family oxidoreductase [Desulfobacterales bacterium]